MARNLKPACKQCRRIGESVCGKAKCAITKRNYPPGQHGLKNKRRLTEYGLQLREKQKAKLLYGILERQFAKYYVTASRQEGNTGDLLLRLLENRFDNVIYRAGYATTRRQARQLVTHGHFQVNGVNCNVPSRVVKVGDVITIKPSSQKAEYFKEIPNGMKMHDVPGWLEVTSETLTAKVQAVPTPADAEQSIAVNLIVEYYSR